MAVTRARTRYYSRDPTAARLAYLAARRRRASSGFAVHSTQCASPAACSLVFSRVLMKEWARWVHLAAAAAERRRMILPLLRMMMRGPPDAVAGSGRTLPAFQWASHRAQPGRGSPQCGRRGCCACRGAPVGVGRPWRASHTQSREGTGAKGGTADAQGAKQGERQKERNSLQVWSLLVVVLCYPVRRGHRQLAITNECLIASRSSRADPP